MTTYAEKLLPHDLEAEEAVLGSVLIDGECLTRLVPLLKGGDFYRERHQVCFDAAMALFQRDRAVDQVTLAGELARTEKLDLVGGMAYLSHLVSITPTSVHAEYYAQSVSRTSGMRRLIDAGNRIVELGYADTDDVEATMRQAEEALFTVRGAGQSRDFVSLRDIYDQYLQEQADIAASLEPGGMPIMSGFPDLDEYLGGLQRADLVILGARPSMGKSSLAVNMAVNAAKSGQTCGIFSLEMTREQLAMRILASEAGIDSHRLRLGLYSHLEEGRIIDSNWPRRPGSTPTASGWACTPTWRRAGSSTPTGLGGRDRLPPPQAGPVLPLGGGPDHRLHRPAVRSPGVHRRHAVPGHGRNAEQGQETGLGAGGWTCCWSTTCSWCRANRGGGSPTGCRRSPRSPAS